MAYIASKDKTFSMAIQTDFGTPASADFIALSCTNPKVTRETEIESPEILTGQAGADSPLVLGARKAKIEFSMYLDGLGGSTAYDPDVDALGTGGVDKVSRWFALLAACLGGKAKPTVSAELWECQDGFAARKATFRDDKVASATAGTITADAAADWDGDQYTGSMVLTARSGTAASAAIQQGWAKKRVAAPGTVVTLYEDAKNTVTGAPDTINIYPTLTTWMALLDRIAFTGRLATGVVVERFTSMICDKVVFHMQAGKRPWIDFSFRAYDYLTSAATGIDLVVPRLNASVGQLHNGISSQLTLGTLAVCGVEDVTITWEPEIREIACHGSGIMGVSDAYVARNHVKASFAIPRNSADPIWTPGTSTPGADPGNVKWQGYLEQGTQFGLGVYGAAALGRCFSILCPSLILEKTPEIEEKDGLDYWKVEAKGSTYSADGYNAAPGDALLTAGDTAATTPMNSLLRVGVG